MTRHCRPSRAICRASSCSRGRVQPRLDDRRHPQQPRRKHICRHNDPADLARLLDRAAAELRRKLICFELVYSMDGDIAPVPDRAARHGPAAPNAFAIAQRGDELVGRSRRYIRSSTCGAPHKASAPRSPRAKSCPPHAAGEGHRGQSAASHLGSRRFPASRGRGSSILAAGRSLKGGTLWDIRRRPYLPPVRFDNRTADR